MEKRGDLRVRGLRKGAVKGGRRGRGTGEGKGDRRREGVVGRGKGVELESPKEEKEVQRFHTD